MNYLVLNGAVCPLAIILYLLVAARIKRCILQSQELTFSGSIISSPAHSYYPSYYSSLR